MAWISRPALAAAPGYEVQVGLTESDNIQRLPSGGSDQTMAFQELGFTWHDKRPWFDVDVDADLSHIDYLQNAYGDQVVGSFLGATRINLVPDFLTWGLTDNFGQSRLDPLAPVTPANQENINYVNTGPTLTLPLGQQTQLGATAEYGRVDYQHSPLDSMHLTGGIDLLYRLSPASNISINATDERIDYDNDQLNPDYTRQETFVRFATKGSRTELGIDLGYTRLDMPGFRDGSFLGRLDVSRRISASSTIGVAVGHETSDGADSFVLAQGLGGATLNTQSTLQSNAPFVEDYATLAWNFQRARTTLNLSANYFRDRYQMASILDNNQVMINARAARQVSPVMQLALVEYLVRQDYMNAGGNATETDTGLQLTWRAGRNLSILVAYYLAHSSSDIQTNNYTENRLWLSIGYGRAAEVSPGPAPLRLPGRQ